jgi:type IV pilus assembly protein PilN
MIRINLLAAERPAQKKRAAAGPPGAIQAYLFLAVFAGGAVVVCAAAWWFKSSQIAQLDTQIAEAEKRQRELQAIKAQVEKFQQAKATLEAKVNLIERLKSEQKGPVHMLDEVSKALPDFVWLTAMTQTGNQVRFGGQSNSLTAVADFINNLQRSGWFPQVDLASSSEANNIVTFALTATFKNLETPAPSPAPAGAP